MALDPAISKTKLDQSKPAKNASVSNKPVHTQPIYEGIQGELVDRLTLLIDVKKTSEHENEQAWVKECLIDATSAGKGKDGMSSWLMPGIVVRAASGGAYHWACRFYCGQPEKKDPFVLVQAGPRKGAGVFVRVDWNPARFTMLQRSRLMEQLRVMINFHLTPGELLSRCYVSRLDIAIDVRGVRPRDFLFTVGKVRTQATVCALGKLCTGPQTLYFGRMGAPQLRVYDKTAEIASKTKGQIPAEVPIMRMEWIMRPGKKTPSFLGFCSEKSNPFASTRIHDLRQVKLIHGNLVVLALLPRVARSEGWDSAKEALEMVFSPESVGQMESALKADQPAWFQPVQTWARVPGMLLGAVGIPWPKVISGTPS